VACADPPLNTRRPSTAPACVPCTQQLESLLFVAQPVLLRCPGRRTHPPHLPPATATAAAAHAARPLHERPGALRALLQSFRNREDATFFNIMSGQGEQPLCHNPRPTTARGATLSLLPPCNRQAQRPHPPSSHPPSPPPHTLYRRRTLIVPLPCSCALPFGP
jgi:hypothetical protein